MYVINKQLIVHVFGVCVKWYVEESNEQVSKSLAIHALQNCRFAPSIFFCKSMECKKFGSAIDILPLFLSFIRGRMHNILAKKMLLHWREWKRGKR